MVPVGVERLGVALEPEEQWERHRGGGGVEDSRVSFVPALDRRVMTYTGWGLLGPRIALAASADLVRWERLGPVGLAFDPAEPLLKPELPDERQGVVPNVVFPTAMDPRGRHVADVYYGMADTRIGAFRLTMGPVPPFR